MYFKACIKRKNEGNYEITNFSLKNFNVTIFWLDNPDTPSERACKDGC